MKQLREVNYTLLIFFILTLLASALLLPGCAQPIDGVNGKDGQSIVGPKGDSGTPGKDGTNGTTIVMVKLCPGTPSYPSTFIEYAFCVDSKLFGTYSDKGGFTTLLLPGQYQSNAINSRCTFIIKPNCQIVNQ